MSVAGAVDLLDRASEEHDADVWAMFSGGDDSLACAIVTQHAARFRGCVHLDTGTGIPETRQYVEETCKAQGWPLHVYEAAACHPGPPRKPLKTDSYRGSDYRLLVLERGFPGPAMHYKMFTRLKERPLEAFLREHKPRGARVVLSTGARSSESERRMGHVTPVDKRGTRVWANPLHDWTKADCLDLIRDSGIPRNEVVRLMHMSGECLCGCFAKPGELDEIALWYPHVAERIRALEAEARAAGVHAEWGKRPPGKRDHALRDAAGRVSALCQQCEFAFHDPEAA